MSSHKKRNGCDDRQDKDKIAQKRPHCQKGMASSMKFVVVLHCSNAMDISRVEMGLKERYTHLHVLENTYTEL